MSTQTDVAKAVADNWSLTSTHDILSNIINKLHSTCILLDSPSQLSIDEYNTQVQQNLTEFNKLLHELDTDTRDNVRVNIPTDIITKINSGHNPDIIVEQLLQQAKLKNDQLRSKLVNTSILQQNVKQLNDVYEKHAVQEHTDNTTDDNKMST